MAGASPRLTGPPMGSTATHFATLLGDEADGTPYLCLTRRSPCEEARMAFSSGSTR